MRNLKSKDLTTVRRSQPSLDLSQNPKNLDVTPDVDVTPDARSVA